MKTLIVSYKYPLPENGGDRIRTMHFVRFFKQKGDVDVMYFHKDPQAVEIGSPFSNTRYIDIYDGNYHKNKLNHYLEKIKYTKPYYLPEYTTEAINKIVNIIANCNYDYVLCRYAINALPLFFLPKNSNSKVIVDIDDVMTSNLYKTLHADHRTIKSITKKLKIIIDQKFAQLYQAKCAKLGKTIICSDMDMVTINKTNDTSNIFIVPNVVPDFILPYAYNTNGYHNLSTILFVGNLSYKPNVEGIIWFIKEVFDRSISDGYQLKLLIAGKEPDPQLRALCNEYKSIELVDSPPVIEPFYDRCGAVIVPLLGGGGTRIKILEAGKALRPIISTQIGAYGLNLEDYKHVLYFKDYMTFMEHYLWLQEQNNYRMLTENMNNYVEKNYSIQNFNSAVEKMLKSDSRIK